MSFDLRLDNKEKQFSPFSLPLSFLPFECMVSNWAAEHFITFLEIQSGSLI